MDNVKTLLVNTKQDTPLNVEHNSIINRQVAALENLTRSIPSLFKDTLSSEQLTNIINNGFFNPTEDEHISYWFARFIIIRKNLWSIIETGINNTGGIHKLSVKQDYQYFVLGYSAVCSLIRIDRFLINNVANNPLIQRKLNEALPEHRIERKQFHYIQKSLVQPSNAIRIHQAHRLLKRKYSEILNAVSNTPLETVFERLPQQERFIVLSRRHYLISWLKSRKLNWKRRGASAKQKSFFSILEYGGRLAADIAIPSPKKVTPDIRKSLMSLLEPGDIFITRHSKSLTNLFLPGFWPHAALYIGSADDRKRLKIELSDKHEKDWGDKNCTFEALKDGLHFRPLHETLNVDSFVVIRPNMADQHKAKAISRVLKHAGKGYNFDFDFFRSDQLVCTEVIYRAYDGINNFNIPLKERMSRKTLSAEDLLDLALDTEWAKPVAIFGVGKNKSSLTSNAQVPTILSESYRK